MVTRSIIVQQTAYAYSKHTAQAVWCTPYGTALPDSHSIDVICATVDRSSPDSRLGSYLLLLDCGTAHSTSRPPRRNLRSLYAVVSERKHSNPATTRKADLERQKPSHAHCRLFFLPGVTDGTPIHYVAGGDLRSRHVSRQGHRLQSRPILGIRWVADFK